MVSVLIPARNERFLDRTVADVLAKAHGPIEVLISLDNDPAYRQEPIHLEGSQGKIIAHDPPVGMRAGIRQLVDLAQGQWLFKLDAHCILAPGWDLALSQSCGSDWVMIPRRYKLDEKTWEPKADFVDYEHFIWPRKFRPISLHGFRWDARALERAACLIDDTLSFQGSAWFMLKEHFERHQFFSDPGYGGLPQQEAEEIGLTTWTTGGRVCVNKSTWYAHWFKGKQNGIGYRIGKDEARRAYTYSYQHWVIERRAAFERVIAQFWPLPEWPEDWQERLYG